MSNVNDEIAKELQAEKERRESAGTKPLKIERNQLMGAQIAWTVGSILIDIATGYAIWQITFWWYGLAWIIAGAGGLVYSNWLRERIGNNYEQGKIAEYGLNVSWISIAIMAGISGVVYVLGYTSNPYIEVITIVSTLGLFIYHVFQSFRFYVKDDEYIERNEEAREKAEYEREMRAIHRAARKVDAKKSQYGVKDNYQQKHGAAFTQAYGKDTKSVELDNDPKGRGGQQ